MINDKAILVGVDGSHASYKATWWAANYAKHAGLTLQIVCAYSLPSYAAVSFDATYTAMGDDNAAHSDAQEILSKAKAIADEQGVEAATLIVTGDPASVFVELSRNYNLIVIGNRGKGGLAERLLGTTSSSLPAYAYCPIVVVPYTDDDGNLMHLNNTITKVAVGSDESKWGLKALEIAADFADAWGAELDVISAVPNMKGSEDEGVMASVLVAAAVSPACCWAPPARACCSMPSDRSTWCRASMWRLRKAVLTRCRAPRPMLHRSRLTISRASRRCRSPRRSRRWSRPLRPRSTRSASEAPVMR